MSQTITLFSGFEIPLIGWQPKLQDSIENAEAAFDRVLELGYRRIETLYQTEKVVGHVLRKWMDEEKLTREEIFVTAALPAIGNMANRVEYFIKKSLENLQLDHVDLYYIDSPVGFNYADDDTLYPLTTEGQIDLDRHTDLVKIYKAMELTVDDGFVRSIGLSNFNARQLKLVIKNARIQPTILQVECHAYFQQKELREVCEKYQVILSTFAPFGFSDGDRRAWAVHQGFDLSLVNDQLSSKWVPVNETKVKKLAEKYGKTSQQILLRFLRQNNIISTVMNPIGSQECLNIFDFELNEKDFSTMLKLDRGSEGRTFDLGNIIKGFDTHTEYPFREPF